MAGYTAECLVAANNLFHFNNRMMFGVSRQFDLAEVFNGSQFANDCGSRTAQHGTLSILPGDLRVKH